METAPKPQKPPVFWYQAPQHVGTPIGSRNVPEEPSSNVALNFSQKQLSEDQALNLLPSLYSSYQEQRANLPEAQQPRDLEADLLGYQKQGLWWMIQREATSNDNMQTILDVALGKQSAHQTTEDDSSRNPTLHPLFEQFAFEDGTPFYFNAFAGQLSLEFPLSDYESKCGILADEMGLGKTVMMLALILQNGAREV